MFYLFIYLFPTFFFWSSTQSATAEIDSYLTFVFVLKSLKNINNITLLYNSDIIFLILLQKVDISVSHNFEL